MKISGERLVKLLTLPDLESLHVNSVSSFQPMELPEVTNLTDLKLSYNCKKFDFTTFGNLLRKMPRLENLRMICSDEYRRSIGETDDDENLKVLRQVAIVAASQNKDIIFERTETKYHRRWTKWKIERKNPDSEANLQIGTLNLVLCIDWEHGLLEQLKTFLNNNLQSHHLVKLEGVREV